MNYYVKCYKSIKKWGKLRSHHGSGRYYLPAMYLSVDNFVKSEQDYLLFICTTIVGHMGISEREKSKKGGTNAGNMQ